MTMMTRANYYVPNTKGEIVRHLANAYGFKKCDLLPMNYKRLCAIYCAKMDDNLYQIKKRLGRELSCL